MKLIQGYSNTNTCNSSIGYPTFIGIFRYSNKTLWRSTKSYKNDYTAWISNVIPVMKGTNEII